MIACENSRPGNPASEWDVAGAGDPSIQGFATAMSVAPGETLTLKVSTTATNYRIDVYRLGWYAGLGARRVATVEPSATLPQVQPECLRDDATGLVDCGNWNVSATWAVPGDAVSGVYVARLVRESGAAGASHVVFVLRDDARGSDVLFQTSDTTWQAYNRSNGPNLYEGDGPGTGGRAYAVSYNRPLATRGQAGGARSSNFFSAEYPMVRWLEANGFDVSYTSGVDTDRRGAELVEHEVFLSVGHDEYWSGTQRSNVEAARGAGVSLGFFSGNEIFWKTRWLPSIDGSATPHRTLVSYKETKSGTKLDPTPTWTGSWRDARLSPPSDGGRPENGLTGQLFMVNGVAHDSIQVPAADGRLRFWRNTSIATLPLGQTAILPAGTLGYEWDENVDNAARPAGLLRLSSATYDSPGRYLLDEGNTYGDGRATHSLSLYRASSGALVFGAGTVQWAWGLDATHDDPGTAVDARMQQSTLNLLIDMGAPPASTQPGLVATAASTDTTAPVSTITSPAPGTVVGRGSPVQITGTAAEGGGVVGGVEVSTDGGATWNRAQGRAAWTYTWTPPQTGNATIRSRAVDDSGNIEVPSAGVGVTVAARRPCPCTLWSAATTPVTPAQSDDGAVEVGVRFVADDPGSITAIRFYRGPGNGGTHKVNLWTGNGVRLATGTAPDTGSVGWVQADLPSPVPLVPGATYVASYHAPMGHYAKDDFAFTAPYVNAPLRTRASSDGGNGVFTYSPVSRFPTTPSGSASSYWVDVLFADRTDPAPPPDSTRPVVASTSPASGATNVLPDDSLTATFSEPVDPASFSFTVTGPGGAAVAGSLSYDAATSKATFDPVGSLQPQDGYTAQVQGARDLAGNVQSGPHTWTFTAQRKSCPCTIFPTDATPANPAFGDNGAVELGVRFVAGEAGVISAIRFYRGTGNAGPHTVNLWSSSGVRLATAAVPTSTAVGWREVALAAPVNITAGTTYVASYYAPTGRYARDDGFFPVPVVSSPLQARASSDGGNGVFAYGSTSRFPGTSSGASSNYWVDVVFDRQAGPPPPTDTTPPTLTSTSPVADATDAVPTANVTATFSEAVDGASFQFTLTNPAGTAVPASVSYDAGSRTATLDPSSALTVGTRYTARVANARDLAGNVQAAPATWSFTVSAPPARVCPCTLFAATATPVVAADGDATAIEVGMRFTADAAGSVSALRFYRGPGNTGPHTVNLWTANGRRLATVTSSAGSTTGWQQVALPSAVPLIPGTTYIVSYHAPTGHFAKTDGGFTSAVTNSPLAAPANAGLYAYSSSSTFPTTTSGTSNNFWVDVVFDRDTSPPPGPDTTRPTVTVRFPAAAATNVPADTTVRATFSEPVDPASFTFTLTDPAGVLVPGGISYDSATRVATFDPTPTLTLGASFVVRVSGARDLAGNVQTGTDSWAFTVATTTPQTCPCSLWSASTTPGTAAWDDPGPLELGVRFQADRAGTVSAVRFYRGPGNTGPHTVNLWSATGTRLATATLPAGTTPGWQQVALPSAVAIAANTVYVASYFAPAGHYARDLSYFSAARVNGPLTAPASSNGGNGVYGYGATSRFPDTSSGGSTNYWVDVVFTPTGG